MGTAGIKYLNAAEIIKYTYKGWSDKDRKAFEDMVINIWYPVITDWTPRYNGNWDAANGQTIMCIGIFLDRRDIFDKACKQLTDGDSNGSIKNYFMKTDNVKRVDVISSMYRWGLLSLLVPQR